MKNFTYEICGESYTVDASLIKESVVCIDKEDNFCNRDTRKVLRAKEVILNAINGDYVRDSDRQYCHYLIINKIRVWEHRWDEEPQDGFNFQDFLLAINDYLEEEGLVEPS